MKDKDKTKEQLISELVELRQRNAELDKVKEALEKLRQKYYDMFENTSDYFYYHDLEGNFIETNLAFTKEMGFTQEERKNLNVRDMIPERYKDQFKDYMERVKKNGKDEGLMAIITKDGRELVLEYKNSLVYDSTGPIGVRGSAREVPKRVQAERALKESEKKYQAIIDSIEEGYYEIDLAGVLTFFNDPVCRMFGYTKDELMGMNYRQYMDEENAKKVFEVYNEVYTTGKPNKGFRYEVMRKDGTKLTIENSISLIRDRQGKAKGFRGITRDITERIRAEDAVRESEEKYRTILENIADGYYEVDVAGNLTFFNEELGEMWGYTTDELMGMNNRRYMDEENSKKVYEIFNKVYNTRKPVKSFNWEFTRKDGKKGYAESSVSLVKDRGGEPIGFRGIVRDITERRRAEEAIRDSEEKHRTIIENIEDSYYEIDLAGNFTFVNDALCRMSGYTKDELMGMNNRDYMDEENAKSVFKAFSKVFTTGIPDKGFQYEIYTKDGRKVNIEVSVSLIKDEGGTPIGFRGVGRDITKRKEAEDVLKKAKEAAESASMAKSNFLANMSHEIRTPMNAVLGFTDMILDTDLDETQVDYARTIKKSGEALVSLLNDILDFSRIEARGLDFEEIDFDPELVVYDVADLVRPRIGLKTIELLCRIGDNIPSRVRGDPLRFRQVVTNLMANAIKFTEAGEVEVSIDVEEEKDGRIKLHTIIRDTGIGIPNENLNTIFEAFKQADDSHTRKYGGTGLGLAICKQIASLMDGDVWAESPARYGRENNPPGIGDPDPQTGGPGSMFHFIAWFGKAEGKETTKFAPVSLVGKRALIVDDNQTNLDILTHVFQLIGMHVVALRNGEDIIPMLQEAEEAESPFSLFISDIQMPDIGGYEVAKKIRNSKYEFSDIPLIALSSAMDRDAQRCEQIGFDGFLSKPVQREKLFQMLDRIMGEKKDESEKHQMLREEIVTQYSVREDMKHSMRILLAEDNPVNQKLANMMLTKAGYKVEVANNGREAFEKYTASPEDFDLIFMDIQMPEMDGLEATKAIREKGFDTIPIIAMTAHALKGDKEKCLDAGMNDYISKPIKRELVFEILEKWVLNKELS